MKNGKKLEGHVHECVKVLYLSFLSGVIRLSLSMNLHIYLSSTYLSIYQEDSLCKCAA